MGHRVIFPDYSVKRKESKKKKINLNRHCNSFQKTRVWKVSVPGVLA